MKSKFKQEVYQVGHLPDTPYAPAQLGMEDLEAGMAKYFNPIKHNDAIDMMADIVKTFKLGITPEKMLTLVEAEFDSKFDNLDIFLEKPLPFDVLIDLAVHDLGGSLRGSTSAGLGFTKDRKTLARSHRDDFKSLYGIDILDLEVYWKLFLKDELRMVGKKTRSIAVGQLHIWFITLKYLGGLYFWFKEMNPDWSAFGMDDTIRTWTNKLRNWDTKATTYGYDIKNQDSKMSPGFAHFLERFLKRHSPAEHWEAIEWHFRESFYNKKMVDIRGFVLSFAQGNISGGSLTILINILHNLQMHVIHTVVCSLLNIIDPKLFLLMGDDTLMQTTQPQLFKEVALTLGHETTSEAGNFLNDIEFLSMKINLTKWGYAPYYSNLDKMFASLVYTTKASEEYFQKICSFRNLLLFSPKGSKERKWFKILTEHARFMMMYANLDKAALASYKAKFTLERSRIGGWGDIEN